MYSENEKLKSTILYYPTMEIPNTDWLRQVLLYWDEIGSIVPRNYARENAIAFSPEVKLLLKEGVFRSFDPLSLIRRPDLYNGFEQELFSIIESERFELMTANTNGKKDSRIHKDKVSDLIMDRLLEKGLATKGRSRDWLQFENTTAHVYMSLLAKYLSQADSQVTIPGTDRDIFQNLLYRSPQESGIAGISFSLLNILPMPREDVSIKKIIDFKNKHELDLLRFRSLIHEFQHELQFAESEIHLREIVQNHQENIRLGLDDLLPRFFEDILPIVFGSLKSVMRLDSPTLWTTSLVMANKATSLVDLSLEHQVAGIAISGCIQIGDYFLSEFNKRSETIKQSKLSYLVAAKKEGILKT